MEIKDLFTKEVEITPELLKDWAVEIGKKVFESDESMSSGEEEG